LPTAAEIRAAAAAIRATWSSAERRKRTVEAYRRHDVVIGAWIGRMEGSRHGVRHTLD
jgi:hypothetical protein